MRRHRRNRRYNRRTDSLGRDISKPYFYKRHPVGRQCECDIEEVKIVRSEQKVGYSDSLVRYTLRECPECGERFAWSEYIIEG